MTTHSSILAWEIPWTEEPGGLQSMGHKRVTLFKTEWPNNIPKYIELVYYDLCQLSRDITNNVLCFLFFFFLSCEHIRHHTKNKFLRQHIQWTYQGFPDSSVGKESACNAGDPSSIPGSARSAGEGIGYPLWYSWVSLVLQLVKNPPAMWETCFGKIPWRRERLLTPVFWPREFHGL